MFSKRFFNLAAFVLICLCSFHMQAGKESVSFYQKISTITNNNFSLQENKYLNAAYIYSGTARNAYIKNSFAKISLKIFDETPFISVPNQDVYFNITCFDVAGNMIGGTSQIRKLNVSNFLSGHNLEDKKDLDMFIVDGAHRVELQVVNSVHAPLTPLDLSFFPANLAFEIEIETERYYQFNALTAVLNSSQVGHNVVVNSTSLLPEELEVYWDAIPGVEEYDLEWAFVDDYDVTSGAFQTGSAINSKVITFKGNSTRVSTPGNFYSIPIVFEHGYIVYRVRGVGRSLNNTDIVLEGSWNLPDGQPLSYYSTNSLCVYHNTGNVHENDGKNWQYNATFAEEGKRKHTVTYADGTLRSRQIITQNNTDKTVIIGQTIYDYQGRKAIETLPVPDPSGQNTFQYHSQFTQNAANVAYTKEDFDQDYVNACNPVTPALGRLSGAGKYYSPNNLLSSPSRPYTPDAFGYAFMQTEYKADNTGRVKTQGGVGDNHYVGSGHEAKYLFGSPDQEEIDALFGTEVGSYVHYQKNVAIDANGQASISYVDLKGKTIATALAGPKPTVMTSIIAPAPSVFDATYINDVTGHGSINGNSTKDNALVFEKKITIEASTPYTINYDIVPEEFSAACISPSGVCYDCVYDLKISLKNECGEELITTATNITGYFTNPSGSNALVGDVGGGTSFAGFIDDGCSNSLASNKYTSASITLATPLTPGEYMLTKTLKVNNDGMEFYLSKYLQSNCVKHLSDFETAATDAMDVSGCNIPCLDCLERTSLCEASYQALLSDVSMGGQYAEYTVTNGVVAATGALSLLNISNALPKVPDDMSSNALYKPYRPDWKHPILNGVFRNYEYENGIVAYVPVAPIDYVTNPSAVVTLTMNASGYLEPNSAGNIKGVLVKDLISLTAFRNAWNANFAKFLVEYHPEFSYYQFCITQSGKSEHYFPEKIVANPPSSNLNPNYANIGTYKTNFEAQWKGINHSFKTKSIVMNPTLITTSIQTDPGATTLSSEQFDDQLNTFVTSINDLSDATNGFCPACATDILNTSGVNGAFDLINIDPYFDATSNPLIANNVFGTRTQDIFNYYKAKLLNTMQFPTVTLASGLTVSNVKQAFMLAIAEPQCNFQNVFYPTTATMPLSCGVNITTDDIWNRYKDFYLSNKRQILFEMADEFAKLTEYGTLFNNVPFGNQNYIYKQSTTSATPNSAPTSYFNQLTAGNYPGSYSLPANYRYIKGYNGCIGNPDFDPFTSDFIRQGSNPRLSNLNTSPGPNYIYPSHFSQVLGFQSDFYDTRAFGVVSSIFLPVIPWTGFNLQPAEGWGFYDRGQSCNAGLKDNFLKKVKRFQSGLGYMQEEYNTGATSAADIVAAIGSQVSYQNQQVMGVCPLANDLTGLLNNLFQGIPTGDVTHPSYNATFNSPLWIFPAFTKLLYDNIIDNIGTCSSAYVFLQTEPDPGTASNVLSLDLSGNFSNLGYGVGTSYSPVSSVSSCVKCTSGNLVTLTIPPGSPYTFSDIVSVNKMTNINGSSFSLMITYQLLVGPNIVAYNDVITGTTCLPLTGCTNDPPPVLCDVTPVGTDLVKLLSALGNSYNNGSSPSATYYTDLFNTTGVVLNPTGPSPINYSSSFTSNILTQLGAASSTYNWQWKQVSAGNFRIFSASASMMDITIFSGSTGLALSSGYTYIFSNLRQVSGQSLIDIKMTNLSTYVSTTGTYVLTAKLNPANSDVPLFDCHIPLDPLCNKSENRTYEELRYFIPNIISTSNFDITNIGTFTNFLKSQLPGGINGHYYLSRPDNGGVPGTWNYKIGQLKTTGFSESEEAACLVLASEWTYSTTVPACFDAVCEINIKDMSSAVLTHPVVWPTLLANLTPASISGSKNDHTLCGSVLYPDGLLDQRPIEITTCWKVEKCCSSSGVDGVVAGPPSLNCTIEYNDFVSDLNALSSSAFNVVTNSSAANASSTIPYNVTDSHIPQADFCSRGYYGMYVNYVNYFTAVETKLSALNLLLPASKQYADPLTDPSSKFYYSLGNFASANNFGRLIEYFNYLTDFTLPVNIAAYNPDDLQSYSEYITSHNPGCNSDCSTALDIVPTASEPIGWNDDCIEELGALAGSNGLIQYQQYLNLISSDFRNAYIAKCLKAKENLSTEYNSNRYHYTLYYYDQAGNLIKTVPPNGVVPFTAPADFAQVVSYRNQNAGTGTPVIKVPAHLYSTLYRYNSLNQLTGQTMPDHDYAESDFYYDKLGRLVVSQNPKQKNVSIPGNSFWRSFSYTKYDELGRITEVGEVNTVPSAIAGLVTSGTNQMSNDAGLSALLFASYKQQITKTSYDYASMGSANFQSDFMRGRVAKTSLDANGDGIIENASHFSYDVHGNVKSLINQYNYNAFENIGNKRIDYDYDLISGKVNSVAFQKGMPDQYYHNYYYDADNRLVETQTSKDGYIWNKDAKYYYYLHGPLSRTEIGDRKVQGQDYYYTIHGWIKGMNGEAFIRKSDPGRDGYIETGSGDAYAYTAATPKLHGSVGLDAFAYSLGYYEPTVVSSITTANKDYIAIRNNGVGDYDPTLDPFASPGKLRLLAGYKASLYNGNIKHMGTSLIATPLNKSDYYQKADPLLQTFKYDQLNRIVASEGSFNYTAYGNATMNAYGSGGTISMGTNAWNVFYPLQSVSGYTYDPNGNINHLTRKNFINGGSVGVSMDDMSYHYTSNSTPTTRMYMIGSESYNTNKLAYVEDAVSLGNGDFSSGQIPTNYDYDDIGNLIKDGSEQIDEIEWNVYGKISQIKFLSNTKSDLEFRYDAKGDRIMKIVKPRISNVLTETNGWIYTIYVRDAQGNVMNVYETKYTNPEAEHYVKETKLTESHLYGSSRLGVHDRQQENISETLDIFCGFGTFTTAYEFTGLLTYGTPVAAVPSFPFASRELGNKTYELSNHLGNVQTTISDKKIAVDAGTPNADNVTYTGTFDNVTDYYIADITSATDYYPFGSPISSRKWQATSSYRYGFNGQEKTDEISGGGNHTTAEYWEYNTRLGRRWNTDPVVKPWESPYACFSNNPIYYKDVNGDDATGHNDPVKPNLTKAVETADVAQNGIKLPEVPVYGKHNYGQKIRDDFSRLGNWFKDKWEYITSTGNYGSGHGGNGTGLYSKTVKRMSDVLAEIAEMFGVMKPTNKDNIGTNNYKSPTKGDGKGTDKANENKAKLYEQSEDSPGEAPFHKTALSQPTADTVIQAGTWGSSNLPITRTVSKDDLNKNGSEAAAVKSASINGVQVFPPQK